MLFRSEATKYLHRGFSVSAIDLYPAILRYLDEAEFMWGRAKILPRLSRTFRARPNMIER
jgi:hypothetical protein